ncbi:V-type proton ATPase subunit S1-like isoform X1 [Amphibalanus amphitrite]|uniref:V-type proton ATPase subunit S1-like isoform X1 n=2 Tax=Amphibalanus amphitrite TaxID=1232801 RepID=UPI001C91F4C2|nr:V-type proton ATPase subunit S1-like isoform X1 [Amphibalanus amphitrite]XP_043215928.1 V-type proton ATPase subunit S1-like isoform X1 [Amphibalanus amphitrite]XP_043215929.1 V-type proton ATPase subunit S1-like isoform X1 [Amphibalanus amphitrite]XP_043215930.1 V-type proton ATPase subunit S1-like isoform X1 [Amphibalanus amphitrite]XP_043215931.1 V-type proton ATPase subunit S1-like isoform X1 [Amphibalanus amphitrite]XP_043215932.1 V-type proton ATPase subunit S1-like isoform X1 [Amphib
MRSLKVLLLLGVAVTTLADKSAPVLVWESTESSAQALPAIPAMSNSQLQKHLNSLDSEALVMFIMNELNVEDFSGYPSAFPQLRREFESSLNAFTPSMSNPSQLSEQLDAYRRVTVDTQDVESLQLADGAQKTLFLVYVGERAASERQAALRRTDELISTVLARVKSLTGKYSAVLTGKHTTMGGEAQRRKVRSLKAADESAADASQFENLGCVFIYTSAPAVIRFSLAGDKGARSTWRVDLGNATFAADCNASDSSQTVTLSWNDIGPKDHDQHTLTLANIDLQLNFQAKMSGNDDPDKNKVSSWTLEPVTLTYSITLDNETIDRVEPLDFSNVYAPMEFSYHCTNRSWMLSRQNLTEDFGVAFSALELPGFQVQAFLSDDAPETFGRAWDCTTFFTIPIWSGLFLSLILLLVLVWSLMMLASVPTMDRFDDPRGQPLHVPNAE